MTLEAGTKAQLEKFIKQSRFTSSGGLVIDLDGTSIYEHQGKILIPEPVERALKKLCRQGRQFVLNSLRFPMSVLRTFGGLWYDITSSPIPTVTLNGSLLGYVTQGPDRSMLFEELEAFPLDEGEIEDVLNGVEGALSGGATDLLVFYYPRDWREGEIVWTPLPGKVQAVKEKYLSASSVTAVALSKLRHMLLDEEICMIFLLIEAPGDDLMAYQHLKGSNFFTSKGVDKRFGAEKIAARIGIDLRHSIGAGDAELDTFLAGMGLAVLVGRGELEFKGLLDTLRIKDAFELGELLLEVASANKKP